MTVVDQRARPGVVVVAAALAVVGGIAATNAPLPTLAAALAIATVTVGLAVPGRLTRAFGSCLAALLVGYAMWGRAFAYVGVAPVFVGELVMALGVFALVADGRRWFLLQSPLMVAMIAFVLWGAARTIPYIATYRADALRDGVIWGYCAFAFAISLLASPRLSERVVERYPSFLRLFLIWAPISIVLARAIGDRVPRVPGSTVPLFAQKPGDVAVHLAGAAAFLLLDLHRTPASATSSRPSTTGWMFWIPWTSGLLLIASLSRGGVLAVCAALAVVMLMRPALGLRKLTRLAVATALGVVLLATFEVSVNVGDVRRISPQQIAANVSSISRDQSEVGLEGSRRWRLLWWNTIVDYTVFGQYFWQGKGFGVNLADADGFQVYGDRSLRSPHNGHLTILARAGIPGLTLWLLLQLGFAWRLLRAAQHARRQGRDWWARVDVWILAYWSAFVVNGAFDVFLEGPQGGIWFWSLIGFGMAMLHAQSRRPGHVSSIWSRQ